MKQLVFETIQALVERLKRSSYPIDRQLSVTALIAEVAGRAWWLLRGAMRTTVFQRRPTLVFLGPRVSIRSWACLHLAPGVTIATGTVLNALSTDGMHIGRNVSIGEYCVLRATGVLSHAGAGLWIGENSGIGPYSYLGAAGGIRIGRDVIMGQHVSFHAETHLHGALNAPIRLQGVWRKGIVIEDDCWVGANATFLDGAHVGSGCVIGAGAVVRGYIPDGSIAVGVPARVIKTRFERGAGPGGGCKTTR